MKIQKRLKFYTYSFIIFTILNIIITYISFNKIKYRYERDSLQNLSFQYQTVIKSLKEKGDLYFDEVINNRYILDTFSHIQNKDSWNWIREKLIKELNQPFKRMQNMGVRQLHFHTADNISFLRMHKLDRFGDSLTDIRYSIKATNRDLKSNHGFEEGRIYNGFRNVYPIIYKDKHLGSVEISFSFQSIKNSLNLLVNNNYKLMISKNIVESRVEDIDSKYLKSSINDNFYTEKEDSQFLISKEIDLKIKEEFANKITNKNSFSILINNGDGKDFVINFLSIKNIENQKIGYIVDYFEDNYISNKFFYIVIYSLLTNIFVLLIIMLFIFHIKRGESIFIDAILENQTNIIFTQKDGQIIQANQKFLSFFQFDSIEDIQTSNRTICDAFMREDGFIYKNDMTNRKFLVNQLSETRDRVHQVKMLDPLTKKPHIFTVNITNLKEQDINLITFSDITPSEFEQREIEDKVYRDKLTGIYNKSKFEMDLKKNTIKQSIFSLVLMNIDNFAKINNKVGHLAGDKIFIEFANIINLRIRKGDMLYRYSETDFIVMVDDKMLDTTSMAKKLNSIIEKNRFFKEIPITASFGVTEYRKFESSEDIIKRVKKALLSAKNSGKNCVITV